MPDIVDAIIKVGILPVIIAFLLYDYSKKLAAMNLELVKMNIMQNSMSTKLDNIVKLLEKLESR